MVLQRYSSFKDSFLVHNNRRKGLLKTKSFTHMEMCVEQDKRIMLTIAKCSLQLSSEYPKLTISLFSIDMEHLWVKIKASNWGQTENQNQNQKNLFFLE